MTQMPSTMKKIIPIPVNTSSFALRLGTSNSATDLEKTIGANIHETMRSSRSAVATEAKCQSESSKCADNVTSKTNTTSTSIGPRTTRSSRFQHKQLCASIPSLLSPSRTSYYADHMCASFGSLCSLVSSESKCAATTYHNHGSYLYRCDYAQHVRFENGQFTMQERIHLPENPEFKIIGRILGPRGNSLRQMEAETRCRIVIRGKGSVKDMHKEKRLRGQPGWEHLDESLHVLITANHPDQRVCSSQLHYAVHCVKSLLTPRFDAYKREQLLQLAIINGTYEPRH